MSTDLKKLKDTGSRSVPMTVNRYWGGEENGSCIQLTAEQEDGSIGYIQLNPIDIAELIVILKDHIFNNSN